jgi:hypothetical protein
MTSGYRRSRPRPSFARYLALLRELPGKQGGGGGGAPDPGGARHYGGKAARWLERRQTCLPTMCD